MFTDVRRRQKIPCRRAPTVLVSIARRRRGSPAETIENARGRGGASPEMHAPRAGQRGPDLGGEVSRQRSRAAELAAGMLTPSRSDSNFASASRSLRSARMIARMPHQKSRPTPIEGMSAPTAAPKVSTGPSYVRPRAGGTPGLRGIDHGAPRGAGSCVHEPNAGRTRSRVASPSEGRNPTLESVDTGSLYRRDWHDDADLDMFSRTTNRSHLRSSLERTNVCCGERPHRRGPDRLAAEARTTRTRARPSPRLKT